MSTPLKISLLLLAILVLTVVSYYFFQKDAETQACSTVTPVPTIAAFGDSLVVGFGAETTGGFVSLLTKQTGVPITNLGENGNTTAQALARINDVLEIHPDIVLVLLGGNDALRKVDKAETEKNLIEIISRLQKEHIRVILLGVPGAYPFSDPYAEMFVRISKEHTTSFVPNVLSGIIGHANLMSDAVHPNEKGYELIAQKVYPTLTQVCNLKK